MLLLFRLDDFRLIGHFPVDRGIAVRMATALVSISLLTLVSMSLIRSYCQFRVYTLPLVRVLTPRWNARPESESGGVLPLWKRVVLLPLADHLA